MALFRQWWVPRGFKSADGGYVHYPLEDLLGVVALESHRNECLVVGEDLGVVPDEIRRALPQFGVYHYKVVLFEQKNGEFVAPADYIAPRAGRGDHARSADAARLVERPRHRPVGEARLLRRRVDRRAHPRRARRRDRERLLRALRRENLWAGDDDDAFPDIPPSSAARCTSISARARPRSSPCSSRT